MSNNGGQEQWRVEQLHDGLARLTIPFMHRFGNMWQIDVPAAVRAFLDRIDAGAEGGEAGA